MYFITIIPILLKIWIFAWKSWANHGGGAASPTLGLNRHWPWNWILDSDYNDQPISWTPMAATRLSLAGRQQCWFWGEARPYDIPAADLRASELLNLSKTSVFYAGKWKDGR